MQRPPSYFFEVVFFLVVVFFGAAFFVAFFVEVVDDLFVDLVMVFFGLREAFLEDTDVT